MVDELETRLVKAATTLQELADEQLRLVSMVPYADVYQHIERHKHLTSKMEGVRLALSYIEEARRIDAEVQDAI